MADDQSFAKAAGDLDQKLDDADYKDSEKEPLIVGFPYIIVILNLHVLSSK